jgi:polysaccharide export outer membrane protein
MQNSKKTFFPWKTIACALAATFLRLPHPVKDVTISTNILLIPCFLVLFGCASCGNSTKQLYFKNLQKDTTLANVVTEKYDLKIMKNDMLGISVASLSPDVAFYNASQAGAGSTSTTGYHVDENGDISFVKLGMIHVAGMTRKQLKDSLEKALVPYLRDAVVSVSFLNRHVTMLGSVSSQVLPMAGDNMTIFDALASTGDITEKGRMDNVLVIREENNSKVFKRLNLESDSILFSPYYYLQPNDIVYVEPAKKQTHLTALQIISYVTTVTSLVILLLDRIIK